MFLKAEPFHCGENSRNKLWCLKKHQKNRKTVDTRVVFTRISQRQQHLEKVTVDKDLRLPFAQLLDEFGCS